jgi:ABC-type lipoprotein export system ATPase subunit/ABC-type antimicrobial peptide transport system permease subunit
MIELTHVSKIYGKKQNVFVALKDVNLKIRDGSTVAIVGKSGSGKSTLMHVMSGLDPASSGIVKVGGRDLSKMSLSEADKFRSSYMSFIFQSFFVEANQTTTQNVMLPLEIANTTTRGRKELVERALKLVELSEKAVSKARNLSGGQKQRLAIARAIVNNPKLIFADEPTGNLDSKTGEKVTDILFDLNKRLGSTLVIVTHDEDLAKKCDAQIRLKDGQVEKVTQKGSAVSFVPSKSISLEKILETVKKPVGFLKRKYKKTARKLSKIVKFFFKFYLWPIKFSRYVKSIPKRWRRTTDLVRRSSRSLKSAKARTILTALAISVGGFTLVLTLAAGNGLRKYTDSLVSSNFDPAELIVGRDREISNNDAPKDTPQEYDETVGVVQGGGGQNSFQFKRVTDSDVADLRSNNNIEQVRELYSLSVRYITREGQKRYTGGAEAYNQAQRPQLEYGELPSTGDIQKGSVLLPNTYLSPLGFENAEQAIGKEISITVQQPFSITDLQKNFANAGTVDLTKIDTSAFKPVEKTVNYKIIGVSKKAATSLSFGVMPVIISGSDARELYDYTVKGTADYGKYLYVFARVKDGKDDTKLQAVKSELESKGYFVQTTKDIQKTITQFVNILQAMVGVFGMITVIASVFGVVNTQYISVLERTREIGMMKALGMSRSSIYRLFKYEAAWIGFIGGLLGIGLGFIVGKLTNPWLTKKLDLGDGNSLLIFNIWQILILIIVLIMVAALAGLLPARKAAKLDPVEALRTE